MKNYEPTLPDEYTEVCHLNALDKKFGMRLNLVAFAVMAFVAMVAVAIAALTNLMDYHPIVTDPSPLAAIAVFIASMFVYIILHELVHGIAYWGLTREKLTFGIGWSCAFCGVPNVYTYRRTSLVALLSPFIVFSVLFSALTVVLFFVHPSYFIFSAILLGMHVGGCAGDLYMTWLLLTKYKSSDCLIRDTGPEQFIYMR